MPSLQDIAMSLVDSVTAAVPAPVPSQDALARCKLISHRGEHDNCSTMENTLEAFDSARAAGVWGIECDIRFTSDLVPVICHDQCGTRVFGMTTPVRELSFAQLRAAAPQIPSLEEVIDQHGKDMHLMLELKEEPWPQPKAQRERLESALSALDPIDDFHFLALNPDLFARVDFIPNRACMPVAEMNVSKLSRITLERGYAGLGGHYLLLGRRLFERHSAQGQRLGIGFPGSRNALFQQLNRGIEWVFSNDAVEMQSVINEHLE